MKILAICLLSFLFVIPSGNVVQSEMGGKPEKVAMKFVKLLNAGKYEAAKKYGTDDTDAMMDMLSSFSGMIESEDEGQSTAEPVVTDMKCEVKGEFALCSYLQDGEPQTLDLVKVNGKWLVDMKKEASPSDDIETE